MLRRTLGTKMAQNNNFALTDLEFHIFPNLNQRYCIQDKKYLNFLDICHETPSQLPHNENKYATFINDFTNKNLANMRQHTLLLLLYYIIIFLNLLFILFFTYLIPNSSTSS